MNLKQAKLPVLHFGQRTQPQLTHTLAASVHSPAPPCLFKIAQVLPLLSPLRSADCREKNETGWSGSIAICHGKIEGRKTKPMGIAGVSYVIASKVAATASRPETNQKF